MAAGALNGDATILVVEDEEPIRQLVCAMLGQSGYRTLEARDGADALRLWEQHAERIRLIITDLIMPGISGTELARHIRRRRPDAAVIFMSGYAGTEGEEEVLETGAVFLPKPFTAGTLAETVRYAMDGFAERRRARPSGG